MGRRRKIVVFQQSTGTVKSVRRIMPSPHRNHGMSDLHFICLCKGSDAKHCACQAQYDAILKRMTQIEAALKTYGRHFIGGDGREACASEYPISFPDEYGRCTCGLEAVLRDTPDG